MEFPDDGDTKGAALTSLDLVVHGLGFGNQKGKEEEAAIASADFRDFVERFVVRAKREDIRALLKRSMGENGIASFRTLLHVGDKIEKIQEDAKKLNPDLLKKQRTNASYISAIAELAPNAAMARLGPEICNELDMAYCLSLEEELFRILEGRSAKATPHSWSSRVMWVRRVHICTLTSASVCVIFVNWIHRQNSEYGRTSRTPVAAEIRRFEGLVRHHGDRRVRIQSEQGQYHHNHDVAVDG